MSDERIDQAADPVNAAAPTPARPLTLAELPDMCTIDQVCAFLQIKRRKFHELWQTGVFPIPEVLPRLGRQPRFSKINLARYERRLSRDQTGPRPPFREMGIGAPGPGYGSTQISGRPVTSDTYASHCPSGESTAKRSLYSVPTTTRGSPSPSIGSARMSFPVSGRCSQKISSSAGPPRAGQSHVCPTGGVTLATRCA